ncbi:MAG: ParB N-terminal domain-containing protein [Oscillospiraceae bacterium]|nr:ParB N-terminal domain-containing protein [Oscillospiraceae bacterium]
MADKKFSLADAMRGAIGSASTTAMGVPDLGTEAREQIEYLPRTALVADEKNFYSLDGINELAASIELIGVQQPLRVRPIEGEDGLYRIVSGHRRRAALDRLALDGSRDYEQVPCIVERDAASPAMQELRLIYANADTRKMSDADLAKQAERVTELLYQLKEEGMEFPGRMRDHVAEACHISKTKLGVIQAARRNLIPELREAWESGLINTSQATALYQATPDVQRQVLEWKGSRELGQMPAESITKALVEIVRDNELKANRKKQPSDQKSVTDNLKSEVSDYMAQREKDDAEFLRICQKYFLAKAVNGGVPKTRGEGICELKYRFANAYSGGGDYEYEGSSKGIKLRRARGKWIERTWTEAWDALAVAALRKAGGST